MEKLNFAKELVYETADFIREKMKEGLDIDTKKNDHDFVTNVDKGAESYLINKINATYEGQDFVTEEKMIETKGLKDTWIIDPIDGTMNFIYLKKDFAISLAYYEDKKPVFGIVYDVVADEMFVGIHGQGAYLNEKALKPLDSTTQLSEAIINADTKTFLSFKVNPIEKIMSQRYVGSAAIEICAVAANRSNAYISRRLNPWDIAAGVIILQEVGGTWLYGDLEDEIYTEDKQGYFIGCGNQIIKESLLAYR